MTEPDPKETQGPFPPVPAGAPRMGESTAHADLDATNITAKSGPAPQPEPKDGEDELEATLISGNSLPEPEPEEPDDDLGATILNVKIQQIPGLMLVRELGRGAAGVVYHGKQEFLDREVAVKMLLDQRQNAEYSARFKREAKLLAGLQHPHIVSCYQADVTPDGVCFLVMEYVDGPNLREYLVENGPLDVIDALCVCRDLASALGSAHEKKIIHRDVKSENVLLAKQSNAPESAKFRYRAKLSDLGLARPEVKELAPGTSLHLTVGAAIMGTPLNMSPEQFDDPQGVDHRTDIYSLGCVLYDMLIASLPFKEKTLSTLVMAKHMAVRGPDPRLERPEIDPEVSELVMAMLAAKREDRPQTYAELIETCAKLIDKQSGGTTRSEQSPARSSARVAVAIGAAVLLGAAGIWWAMSHKGKGEQPLPPAPLALTIQAPERVNEGDEVVLSATPAGFASAMPTLVWNRVAGPEVDLKQNGMTATFTAPHALKLYELQFTASGEDSDGKTTASPPVTVQVAATDEAPTITIEGSKIAQENGPIRLSASVVDLDAHGNSQYLWRQTSGRPVQFEANQNPLSFTAPEAAGAYFVELALTVKAGSSAWEADPVRVDVSAVNDPPVVVLPTPPSAEAGEQVSIEAQVQDIDSVEDLKFEWRVETPAGLRVDISDPKSRTAQFTLPENPAGNYDLELALWTTDGTQAPLEQKLKLPVTCEPAIEAGKTARWIAPITAERLAGWAVSEPPPKLKDAVDVGFLAESPISETWITRKLPSGGFVLSLQLEPQVLKPSGCGLRIATDDQHALSLCFVPVEGEDCALISYATTWVDGAWSIPASEKRTAHGPWMKYKTLEIELTREGTDLKARWRGAEEQSWSSTVTLPLGARPRALSLFVQGTMLVSDVKIQGL